LPITERARTRRWADIERNRAKGKDLEKGKEIGAKCGVECRHQSERANFEAASLEGSIRSSENVQRRTSDIDTIARICTHSCGLRVNESGDYANVEFYEACAKSISILLRLIISLMTQECNKLSK
jgi:hypothetical protein